MFICCLAFVFVCSIRFVTHGVIQFSPSHCVSLRFFLRHANLLPEFVELSVWCFIHRRPADQNFLEFSWGGTPRVPSLRTGGRWRSFHTLGWRLSQSQWVTALGMRHLWSLLDVLLTPLPQDPRSWVCSWGDPKSTKS